MCILFVDLYLLESFCLSGSNLYHVFFVVVGYLELFRLTAIVLSKTPVPCFVTSISSVFPGDKQTKDKKNSYSYPTSNPNLNCDNRNIRVQRDQV